MQKYTNMFTNADIYKTPKVKYIFLYLENKTFLRIQVVIL